MWRGLAQPRAEGAAGGTETAGRIGILVTVLLWGSQFALTHDLAQRWDAYTMNALRYPVGAAVLLGLAAWRGARLGRPATEAPTLWRKALLGLAMAAFATLFTVAIAIGDPVSCAVMAALAPVIAALVGWAVEGRAPQRSLLLPLALVVPGAVLASVRLGEGGGEGLALGGAGLILVAQVCWSWYSLKAQRWMQGASQIEITGRSLLYCCPYVLAVWAVAGASGAVYSDWQTSPGGDAAVFAVLIFGALITGILLWNVAVARIGIAVAALHLNLIPVVAIATAMALGIEPRPEQLAGAGLVIAGVLVAQRPWALLRRRPS